MDALLNLFKKESNERPYPEEAKDPSKTKDMVNVEALLVQWFDERSVPSNAWDYWDSVRLGVYDKWEDFPRQPCQFNGMDIPAFCEYWIPEVSMLASWANVGVLSHELAHVVWFNLLTDKQRADFETDFNKVYATNKMLHIIFGDVLPRGITEAYPDVYRYMGEKMPRSLLKYYPKLF